VGRGRRHPRPGGDEHRLAAAALVDAFLDWARERGAAYAVVTAFAANAGAQRFYERRGFGSHTVTLRTPL